MKATTPAAAADVPPQPVRMREGLPVYRSQEAPAQLCTQSQLKERRLKLAEGQQPVAYVRINRPHPGAGDAPLYRPEDAARMRPLSERQRQAVEARRTCVLCRTRAAAPLPHRERPANPWLPQSGPVCDDCNRRHRDRWQRTCERCGTAFLSVLSARTCTGCHDAYRRAEDVVRRLLRRHCPECCEQTATREEITVADAADPYGRAYGFPRTCAACQAVQQRREQEARWAAERARWDELGPVRQWARRVLAQPHRYAVLDLETTGVDAESRVVEVGITTAAGETLLDTLVHPGIPIPEEATGIHGITDDDVRDAPSFGDVLPRIGEALHGRGIIIYNRRFDTEVLRFELDLYHREHTPALPGLNLPPSAWHPAALAWMDTQQWEPCAMLANAVHVGEWSDYWGKWAWPRLNGGHRAADDCQAVVRLLHTIADACDPEPLPSPPGDTPELAPSVALLGHVDARADTE